ncbi:MAG: gamma-glutamyltransferase family protein [Firmicutes bacterium]|nr:gamma-glutamyltransferase family protein [Bacillota bacterium]
MDPLFYQYPSRRQVVYAHKGMVASSTPQSAQAGLEIMQKGGNAIDAAVAAAITQTVCEPGTNGIGSDAFALLWTKGRLYGINGSGPSVMAQTLAHLKAEHETMPKYGWPAVNVPGAPATWAALAERFGNLPLSELVKPAVRYAREGFAVAPSAGAAWQGAHRFYKNILKGDEFAGWFSTFAPNDKPYGPGDLAFLPDHAQTLLEIGESNAESFYRGDLAKKIVAFAEKTGGKMTLDDLSAYQPEWVEPISVNYRGYDVYEIPPNGHGISALMALNILKGFELKERENAETYHKMMESMKLAFVDAQKYVTDPGHMKVDLEALLSEDYAAQRRSLIGRQALLPEAGQPQAGGTIYLCAADGEGNMISYIQSNYNGFGSGIVVPGTGIALNNRGFNFTLDESHDNVYAPGKKPYHTIIPGFLVKDNQPIGPFGVMGGFMQPQGHLQVVVNTVDYKMNPQDALDATRFQWTGEKTIEVEQSMAPHIQMELLRRGHRIVPTVSPTGFGRGQIIWRLPSGILVGGTESRTDGSIFSW